jgi:hypothetical protein
MIRCHASVDAFAPTPGWSGRVSGVEAGRHRYLLVLGSMGYSWLWFERGAGPWRYGLTESSVRLISSPGHADAFLGLRVLRTAVSLSGYRCCPGLGLFTKEVPMLLGQAGISLGSPGVAPGPRRLRVGCTVCQYAEPVEREIAPGGAAPPFPPYERGVVLLDHGAVPRTATIENTIRVLC